MSVNKLGVPTTDAEDSDINHKPQLAEAEKEGKNLSADTKRNENRPDMVSSEFSDDFSNNAQANRTRSNPNDPTDRDPTRSSDRPMTGKLQK
jgi:hypothetical protein